MLFNNPSLETTPCANVQMTEQSTTCKNQGKLVCSACKLVSYCSKECQMIHWKLHKRCCKNRMRSEDWKPIWIVENRPPSFISDEGPQKFEEEFQRMTNEEFSVGFSLWGNTPAMDVINLPYNEKDASRDFSLAFVASGDLRHVVHTINSLPSNYSGNLHILINDVNPVVICRNFVLLLILGTISDEVIAADVALHFWYSSFIPAEYILQISIALLSFVQYESRTFPLGPHSTLSGWLSTQAKECLSHFISSPISFRDAQDEYARVRNVPSRCDYRDRMYIGLRPSHRVAFQEYRRSGIVLPFGASKALFNCPNVSLFSPDGKWLQTDYADPLEGWDLRVIVEVGKAHGAQSEDIYGCLYFFLSDQLRMFSQRLRNFKISFKVFPFESCHLSKSIRLNEFVDYGLPASIVFDRIVVSNILDTNYVGLRGVLTHWAPLLARNSTAAIVGYFMNWVAQQEDGRVEGAGTFTFKNLIGRMMDKIMVKDKSKMQDPAYLQNMIFLMLDDVNTLYDNSKPFSTFLMKEGLEGILRETELGLREKHTIVPHREMVSLQAKPSALPEFSDDDSWYYFVRLGFALTHGLCAMLNLFVPLADKHIQNGTWAL